MPVKWWRTLLIKIVWLYNIFKKIIVFYLPTDIYQNQPKSLIWTIMRIILSPRTSQTGSGYNLIGSGIPKTKYKTWNSSWKLPDDCLTNYPIACNLVYIPLPRMTLSWFKLKSSITSFATHVNVSPIIWLRRLFSGLLTYFLHGQKKDML